MLFDITHSECDNRANGNFICLHYLFTRLAFPTIFRFLKFVSQFCLLKQIDLIASLLFEWTNSCFCIQTTPWMYVNL